MKHDSNILLKILGGWLGLISGVLSIPLAALAVFYGGKLCFAIPAFASLFFFAIQIIRTNRKLISEFHSSWVAEKATLVLEHNQQLETLKEENKILSEKLKEKEKQELVKTNIGLSMMLLKNRLAEASVVDPSLFDGNADARKEEWQKTNNLFTYVEKELAENFSVSAYTLFRNAVPRQFDSSPDDPIANQRLSEWQQHVSHIETKLRTLEKISEKLMGK